MMPVKPMTHTQALEAQFQGWRKSPITQAYVDSIKERMATCHLTAEVHNANGEVQQALGMLTKAAALRTLISLIETDHRTNESTPS